MTLRKLLKRICACLCRLAPPCTNKDKKNINTVLATHRAKSKQVMNESKNTSPSGDMPDEKTKHIVDWTIF